MSALHRLPGAERSQAVSRAFTAAYRASVDGRAKVTFKRYSGENLTVEVFLVGTGWNATFTGTQEALVVRKPESRFNLDLIPYTRLISIEPC